jgi:predicted DNA-binding transcriptional regulator YafY
MDRYLLVGVHHLGAAKGAAVLDVSVRTIARYRAALRSQS